jgi:lysozyme family protein
MHEIEEQVKALQNSLDNTLWDLLEDRNAAQPARAAADQILKERLNEKLVAAVTDFHAGTFKFLNLIDRLEDAVTGLSKKADKDTAAKFTALLDQAREIQRRFHDAEGLRTTYMSPEELADIQSDEKAEPPSGKPKQATAAELDVPRLVAPRPKNSRRYDEIADEYIRFFAGADYASPEKEKVAEDYARKILQYRSRYEEVVKGSKIPWWFVGLTHMMESSLNFNTHLHNGDPLTRKTFRVPAGRPARGSPPFSWVNSAHDALVRLGLFDETDWSLSRALYRLEQYNGFGYRKFGVASPYLWSFSSIYAKGKFVADGVFSPDAASKQCGAATVLKFLTQKGAFDPQLDYVDEDESANASTFEADANIAVAKGTNIVDPTMPADANFDAFIRQEIPTLRHFQPSEFLTRGGSNAQSGLNEAPPQALWPNVVKLVQVLDELRERLQHPIVLNSVYRGDAYNKSVGGVSGSQHRKFCAGDFRVVGFGGPEDWARELRGMRKAGFFQGGIGVYKTFVHVDTRGWPANWTG